MALKCVDHTGGDSCSDCPYRAECGVYLEVARLQRENESLKENLSNASFIAERMTRALIDSELGRSEP